MITIISLVNIHHHINIKEKEKHIFFFVIIKELSGFTFLTTFMYIYIHTVEQC